MLSLKRKFISPLEIIRTQAWFHVLKEMGEFKNNYEFIECMDKLNDACSDGEDEYIIIESPKEAVYKWLNKGKPPSYEILRKLSDYICAMDGEIYSRIVSGSFIYGPSGLFRGYQLGSQVKGDLLSIDDEQDVDWVLKEHLMPNEKFTLSIDDIERNLTSSSQTAFDSILKTHLDHFLNQVVHPGGLMKAVHNVIVECEVLSLTKYTCSLNKNPHAFLEVPVIQEAASAGLEDSVSELFQIINMDKDLDQSLKGWGLSLEIILKLIPDHFLYMYKIVHPAKERFALMALSELKMVCVNFAPLEPIVRSITQDNVK